MSGARYNRKAYEPSKSLLSNRKKEGMCKIYGHTAGKVRAGNSMFCSVCGKRFTHS